jgi:sterol desaturase/sphingolipid hydroxylase (fatty acid hydroxylase superfamily)
MPARDFTAELVRFAGDTASSFVQALILTCILLMIVVVIEGRVPNARPPSPKHAWFNVRYTVVMLALIAASRPLTMSVPWHITQALGAGWITFSDDTFGLCAAFVCVLLMTDLLEYLFHRAQHTFGLLWKMHEFHHSAEHYDVTLCYRNFWLEPLLKVMFMYPLVGIVFQVPGPVASAVGWVYLVNHHVAHMNLRFSPGRFGFLVSHPQYHRLHHSRHERDYNKNFCDLLPLWDVLFGTLHRPKKDEFVDVGLDSGLAPRSVWAALLWPWQRNRQAAR